jgi:hypothetical protein
MPTGFVALLDVLGFSSLVSGDGGGERLQKYLETLQKALDPGPDGQTVEWVVFSDSIVLTTYDDDRSFQALLLRCSRMFGLMLEIEVPLRGAIAHGPFLRQGVPGGVFVAGRAIVDAYRFETAQDWVGIMLAPSAVKRFPGLEERCEIGSTWSQDLEGRLAWAAFIQRYHRIPFHKDKDRPFDDSDFDGFAIVPTDGILEPPAIRDSLDRSIKDLKWLKSLAPDPAAQGKYKSAIRRLENTCRSWRQIAYSWERAKQRP